METKTNLTSKPVPTLKNALRLIGFKELAANVYIIPPAKKLNAYKNKVIAVQ